MNAEQMIQLRDALNEACTSFLRDALIKASRNLAQSQNPPITTNEIQVATLSWVCALYMNLGHVPPGVMVEQVNELVREIGNEFEKQSNASIRP